MSIIKNILVISDNENLVGTIKGEVLKNHKSRFSRFDNRTALSNALADVDFDAVIVDDRIEKKTWELAMRAFTSPMINKEMIYIFLTTNIYRVDEAKGLLDEETSIINLSLPVSATTIVTKLEAKIYPRKKIGGVASKKKKHGHLLDVDFLEVFIESTKNAVSQMVCVDPVDIENKKPFLLTSVEILSVVIRAKIAMDSSFFRGSFFVSFPRPSFLALYRIAVDEEHEDINDENRDFAAELANVIYGGANAILMRSQITLDMVTPTLDTSYRLRSPNPIIVIPFDMKDVGTFYIKIAPGLL